MRVYEGAICQPVAQPRRSSRGAPQRAGKRAAAAAACSSVVVRPSHRAPGASPRSTAQTTTSVDGLTRGTARTDSTVARSPDLIASLNLSDSLPSPATKRSFFECFPYVCPEPVLAK